MKNPVASERMQAAADRVSETAQQVREMASGLLKKEEEKDREGGAHLAADALGTMSDSLEAVAESARASGLALRDQGRDAARALARGERTLRKTGFPGAAADAAIGLRRNAGKIVAAGAGVLALILLRRVRRDR